PFLAASISGVDYELFADDQSLIENQIEFARGLHGENPQRNTRVRVYVQAHNRGSRTATNVVVKVFFAASGVGFPDLPAVFWSNFPNNTLPADSPWQPVAAHQTIHSIAPGRSAVAGFEWTVPATATDATALLSIISAEND